MPALSRTLFHVRIPMRYSFGHARAVRSVADNVVVRVALPGGALGWGECVPREYVTGETIASVFARLEPLSLEAPPDQGGFAAAARWLYALDLPRRLAPKGPSNAAACALELALLDAAARAQGVPAIAALDLVPELLPLRRLPPQERVCRTVTIGDDIDAALQRAGKPQAAEYKLKVGFGMKEDLRRVERVRALIGAAGLRLDANCAWSEAEGLALAPKLAALGVRCVEDPFEKTALGSCARLRRETGLEVMLDEGLCSEEDLAAAHAQGALDWVNVRLSKCGGLFGALRLVASARALGLRYQLGSMVGESGILSSWARHFAARVAGVEHLEAPIPRQLLEADLTDADLEEDPATRLSAPPPGPGFGALVRAEVVERYAVERRAAPVPS